MDEHKARLTHSGNSRAHCAVAIAASVTAAAPLKPRLVKPLIAPFLLTSRSPLKASVRSAQHVSCFASFVRLGRLDRSHNWGLATVVDIYAHTQIHFFRTRIFTHEVSQRQNWINRLGREPIEHRLSARMTVRRMRDGSIRALA